MSDSLKNDNSASSSALLLEQTLHETFTRASSPDARRLVEFAAGYAEGRILRGAVNPHKAASPEVTQGASYRTREVGPLTYARMNVSDGHGESAQLRGIELAKGIVDMGALNLQVKALAGVERGNGFAAGVFARGQIGEGTNLEAGASINRHGHVTVGVRLNIKL